MFNTWLVIIPPILVLFLSFLTHRVTLSLFLGIISAALIFYDFSIIPALKHVGLRLWETSELGNLVSWKAFLASSSLFIYLFLLILGIIITVIATTGGTKAYGNFIQSKLRSKKSAETSTLFLSLFFFIDDYLNVLTVGSVMPPITDRFKVPRIKIAFFLNAFAAALCIIVPFSSWGAFILRQLQKSGISATVTSDTLIVASPLTFFINAIPFAFASFIAIASAFFIVRKGISFGLMHKHEMIAEQSGNLYGGKVAQKTNDAVAAQEKELRQSTDNSMFDFLFPILFLVTTIFVGLLAFRWPAANSLFFGGFSTLAVITPYFIARKKLQISQLKSVVIDGIHLMLPTLIVITLAWTFGEILTEDLKTGQFLATKLIGTLPLSLVPCLFFVVATITTLTIGSAWGSIAVIIPIGMLMVTSLHGGTPPFSLHAIPIALPTLSAILAGAVTGNVLTPIADIVIMASTTTQSNHMDHVKSQQVYMMPIFFAATAAFLASGLLINRIPLLLNTVVSLVVGLLISFGLFSLLNKK